MITNISKYNKVKIDINLKNKKINLIINIS